MSDFHWHCSQIKYKQQNFACDCSCIEETLKHPLNLREGLCIYHWAAVLKDLPQSPRVGEFLVTPWSWPMAISTLLDQMSLRVFKWSFFLWVWHLCLQTSDGLLPTFQLAEGSPGGGAGTLPCSDCRSSCSVNICWFCFSSVGILPFSGKQTFALPSFQYWAGRGRWWLLLHTRGLKASECCWSVFLKCQLVFLLGLLKIKCVCSCSVTCADGGPD